MKKLIRSHQWITKPDPKGISYFGITDFAKDYFLRFKTVDHFGYFKTNYGINFRHSIKQFLDLRKDIIQAGQLTLSEQMQYDRFVIRQDEPFTLLKTIEFDVQLSAPVDMRALQLNFQVSYNERVYQQDWIYKVQIMNADQLQGLMSQEKYAKSNKLILYNGLLS